MLKSVSRKEIDWHSRARNSKVTNQILQELLLVRDFMPALVICKFDDDSIKYKGIMLSTTVFRRSKASD